MILVLTLLGGLLAQAQPENMPRIGDPAEKTFWFPEQASMQAVDSDRAFEFIVTWVSGISLVGVTIALLYFVWKYRRKHPNQKAVSDLTHHTALELTWSIIPLFLVLGMFWVGFTGYTQMTTAPADAMTINVIAKKWDWNFLYPSGLLTNELHVPLNRNVKIVTQSDDVIHSFFIPAFRIKRDAVPGKFATIWFRPTKVGEYLALCAEFCGTNHSNMMARVVVHGTQEEFDEWVRVESDIFNEKGAPRPLPLVGKKIWERNCMGCHSIDGAKNTGPTFQNLWTRNDKFTDGTDIAALKKSGMSMEDYIRQSIEYPQQKIVAGYESAQMPTFKGRFDDRQYQAIFAFLKSLDDQAKKELDMSAPGKDAASKPAPQTMPTEKK